MYKNKLKECREEKGMTLKELAEKVGFQLDIYAIWRREKEIILQQKLWVILQEF